MSLPTFTIDLDKAPRDRWTELITHFKSDCLAAINHLDAEVNSTFLGKTLSMVATSAASVYLMTGNVLYKDEIESIAGILGIPAQQVLLAQLSYEMHSCCSSIVVNCDGTNMFYRTMDWPLDYLKKLTCKLDFKRNGRVIFTSISWAGFIGILTAMVPSKYAISVNFRTSDGNLLGNAKRCLTMSWPTGYLVRELLEMELSYDDLIYQLQACHLISPCYFTVCNATGVSNVIIRDFDKCVQTLSSAEAGYLIQTNKDPGNLSSCNILRSYEREALARKIIAEKGGQWQSIDDVVKAFTVDPILNEETVYICGMVPSQGILNCRVV